MASYNLAGNGNSAQLKENPDGTVTISNAGKTGTFQKSQVANYLGAMDKAAPTNNVALSDPAGEARRLAEQKTSEGVRTGGASIVKQDASGGATAQGPVGTTLRTVNGVTRKYDLATGQEIPMDYVNGMSQSTTLNRDAADAAKASGSVEPAPTPGGTPTQNAVPVTAETAQASATQAGTDQAAAIAKVQAAQGTPVSPDAAAVATANKENAAEKTALNKSEAASSEASDLEAKALVERNKRDQELSVQLSDLENQKIKDEQNAANQKVQADMAEAKRQTFIAENMAAVAMQKLGLTHSGSSVATFQAIATQGFQKLAQIEADFTLANSKLAYEAQKNRLGLQKDLNKIIDDSTDKLIENRKNTAIRIAEHQKNLLKSDSKKEKAIKDALNEAKEEKRKTEDRTLALSQARVDAANAQADRLKKLEDENRATASKSIDTLVSTGQWLRMGDAERLKMEQEAGVPVGSTYSKVGSQAAQDFRTLVDGLGVKGYFPSISQTDAFTKDVVSYMKLGDSRAEAVNKAFSKYISADSKLQALLKKASSSGSAKETYVTMQTKAKDAAGVTYDRTVEVPRSWVLAQREKGLTGDQIADAASSYGIPVKESAMPEDKKTEHGTRTTRYETRDGKLYKVTTQDNRTLYDEEVRATARGVPGYNEALGSGSQDGENQEDEENE